MSSHARNPFEYEAANNLSVEQIREYYIEDFSYSRFIKSKRNIVLAGERGCGKTMTLLYNSFKIQFPKPVLAEQPSIDYFGVYVPCNTPLMHKREYQLLDSFKASVLSEHYLVLTVLYYVADTLADAFNTAPLEDETAIREELEITLGWNLQYDRSLWTALKWQVQRELADAQKHVNDPHNEPFYNESLTFGSAVLPVLRALKSSNRLARTHFLFMIDDAHDLNEYQRKVVNSWIGFRDHTDFSFKVAVAKVDRECYTTVTGGAILPGHDFTLVDMERPFQNDTSEFGKLAERIVNRRLERVQGLPVVDAKEFFPLSPEFDSDLAACRARVMDFAAERYNGDKDRISDYVYKYTRADYFRSRSTKANRPPYSGFETITHLSTGVIRNLLEPCYLMYERVLSEQGASGSSSVTIDHIPANIQAEIILAMSDKLWERLRSGLDTIVPNCTKEEATQVYHLFDNLAAHFRDRLLHHQSEPRAINFTVSGMDAFYASKLIPLLDIARKAHILFTRNGPSKDEGARETYYVPNRLLWPARGLDPVGQHARASLRAEDLWAAASMNKPLPPVGEQESGQEVLSFG